MNNEFSLDKPPRGIKMERSLDGDTIIKIRLLSTATLPMLLYALVWNGFLSIFISKLSDASFLSGNSMLWFFRLFLIPFIAIGVFLLLSALFKIFGRCEIRLGMGEGRICSGVGPIGRTQRFSLQSIRSLGVRETASKLRSKGSNEPITSYFRLVIEMNTGHEIKSPDFGEMRGTWLAFALGKILNRPIKEIKDRAWKS